MQEITLWASKKYILLQRDVDSINNAHDTLKAMTDDMKDNVINVVWISYSSHSSVHI